MTYQQVVKRATITDVARLAGVSISTVSRVVNDTAPVADETVLQVRNAIDLLNYTPMAAARTLAGHKTNTIGLLLPQISSAFFSPLVSGIESGAREAGFDMIVHLATDPHNGGDRPEFAAVGEHNTDGLVIFTDRLDNATITRFWRNGLPMVLLFRTAPEGLPIPSIRFANRSGARAAVEHLIVEHGRKRIVYLAGPAGNQDSEIREAGYREALQAHGIPFDPELIAVGNYDNVDSQAAIDDRLTQGVQFDAIFAADDEAAAGAMLALRQAGRAIPQEVSVVGFDNVEFSNFLSPPLTTVDAPIEDAGVRAARNLIRLVRGQDVPIDTILETGLVIRQSCGCA